MSDHSSRFAPVQRRDRPTPMIEPDGLADRPVWLKGFAALQTMAGAQFARWRSRRVNRAIPSTPCSDLSRIWRHHWACSRPRCGRRSQRWRDGPGRHLAVRRHVALDRSGRIGGGGEHISLLARPRGTLGAISRACCRPRRIGLPDMPLPRPPNAACLRMSCARSSARSATPPCKRHAACSRSWRSGWRVRSRRPPMTQHRPLIPTSGRRVARIG